MEMLRFGDVVLDVGRGLLRDSKGAEVALRPKSLDLLLELARNPGHILSRDELFDAVWPDVTVTEDSIAQCVHEVRRAIGDPEGRILRTIVKRGYCLDVEESVPPTAAPPTAAPEHAPSAQTAEGRPSLVILPFQSIPYDPETEWFADGIVEEITTALSRFRSLFVIARNSAFTFKGQPVDVRDVGQRLGVRYVLEGSVRRALDWLVGMQSKDGGFAAFDADNTSYYLNAIPFADHGALLDPPTSDVSGRVVTALGLIDRPQDGPVLERAIAALRAGDTHYTPVTGRERLRAAIARAHRARTGQAVDASNVIFLAGAQNALFTASLCLAGPGDEVIALEPLYPTYPATIEVSGARMVRVPAPAATGFRVDLAALEAAITPSARCRISVRTSSTAPRGM